MKSETALSLYKLPANDGIASRNTNFPHTEKLIEISINLKSFFHQQILGENKIPYWLKLDVAIRRCLHLN